MEGKIIHEKIYVDFWKENQTEECCYFMSKIHHKWNTLINENWKFPIYSSKLNLKYLLSFTKVNKKLLKILDFDEQTSITIGNFTFKVTAINSGSYTGKIIFHFSYEGNECLYMNGALMSPDILSNPYIVQLSKNKTIDTVYIDTPLLRTPMDYTLKSAVNYIVKLLQSRNVVIAMPKVGMEDLLVAIASKGYSVHVGSKRHCILQLQDVNLNITRSKEVALRVVDLKHCENIEHTYRRFLEKKLIQIIPSTFYTLEEIFELQKLGIHIVCYSDYTTPKILFNFLKIIQPKNLLSCNKENPIELLNRYILYYESNISLNSTYLPSAQIIEDLPPIQSNSNTDSFDSPAKFAANENERNNNIDSKSNSQDLNQADQIPLPKNVCHLYSDTQESFVPLATSTQKNTSDKESSIPEITPSQIINNEISEDMMHQILPYSQRDLRAYEDSLFIKQPQLLHEQHGAEIIVDDSPNEENVNTGESAVLETNVLQYQEDLLKNEKNKRKVSFNSDLNEVRFIENIIYSDDENVSIISSTDSSKNNDDDESLILQQNSEPVLMCSLSNNEIAVNKLSNTSVLSNFQLNSQESHFSNVSDVDDSDIESCISRESAEERIGQISNLEELVHAQSELYEIGNIEQESSELNENFDHIGPPKSHYQFCNIDIIRPCFVALKKVDLSKIPLILTENQEILKQKNNEIFRKFEKLGLPNLDKHHIPIYFTSKFLEHIDANFIESNRMTVALTKFSLDEHWQNLAEISKPKKGVKRVRSGSRKKK